MQAYSFFSNHFSGVDELKVQVSRLENAVEQEKIRTQVAYHEAEIIRQDVATLFPDKIKSAEDSYQVRSLASVLQVQEPLKIDSSKSYLKRGKELFASRKYNEAITVFKSLID